MKLNSIFQNLTPDTSWFEFDCFDLQKYLTKNSPFLMEEKIARDRGENTEKIIIYWYKF